jgi:uncharacterized membrane protein
MARGKIEKHSPIIDAIRETETTSTGEIRVHLSHSWLERDAFKHAENLFSQFNMYRTRYRNGVLIYANLRKKKFAIIVDVGLFQSTGQTYWNQIGHDLTENLRSTHSEKAIATTVHTIGEALTRFFPIDR